jgi:uncharacterized protein YxeA
MKQTVLSPSSIKNKSTVRMACRSLLELFLEIYRAYMTCVMNKHKSGNTGMERFQMKISLTALTVFLTVIVIAVLSCSTKKEERQHPAVQQSDQPQYLDHTSLPAEGKEAEDIYGDSGKPQQFDVISGKEIDREVFADHNSKRVYFHCPICRDRFQLRASVYLDAIKKRHILLEDLSIPLSERINEQIIGEPGSPQSVDVISGKPVNPDVYGDYNGKRVYFCCLVSKGLFEERKQLYLNAIKKRGIILKDTPEEKE